jgi:predicted dinucleotide-utilizing enzyme
MRIGVIGAGRIGGAVIAHLRAGGPASLVAVLRRSPAAPGETADPVAFLARDLDLILDCAGPRALATLGPAALGRAEVWSPGARAHPDRVNVAVAAALAGPGIDATRLLLRGTGPGGAHRLSLATACSFGRVRASVTLAPPRDGALHPAAASLIAALQARLRPVRAG